MARVRPNGARSPAPSRSGDRRRPSGRRHGHGGARWTTRSARASREGRWATMTTVRPTISRRTAASTPSSVRPSRLAVGSSRRSSGASRRNARASATRWRSPADSPAPSWPSTVSHPSGSRATTVVEAGVGHGGAHRVVGGVGTAEPDVVGDRPGEEVGSLGDPGDLGPPRVRVQVGQAHALRPCTEPRPRWEPGPSSTASRVDFPQPLGPAMATTSPGSDGRATRPTGPGAPAPGSRPPAVRPGALDRDGSGTSRRVPLGGQRPLEDLEDVLGRLHPFGTGVIVGAEEAQGEVGLGGQDEDEQGGGQAQVAAEQPEPDGHGHQGHRDGGQELEDERGQERHLRAWPWSPSGTGR